MKLNSIYVFPVLFVCVPFGETTKSLMFSSEFLESDRKRTCMHTRVLTVIYICIYLSASLSLIKPSKWRRWWIRTDGRSLENRLKLRHCWRNNDLRCKRKKGKICTDKCHTYTRDCICALEYAVQKTVLMCLCLNDDGRRSRRFTFTLPNTILYVPILLLFYETVLKTNSILVIEGQN